MQNLDLHLTEEDLEAYAMMRTGEYLSGAMRDHLLLCPLCRMALERIEQEIELMRLVLN